MAELASDTSDWVLDPELKAGPLEEIIVDVREGVNTMKIVEETLD